jgi:hypothetical protein
MLKVIILADLTLLGLLSKFSCLKRKKFTKSQSPNVYRSVEIRMFIMPKNRTKAWSTNLDFYNVVTYFQSSRSGGLDCIGLFTQRSYVQIPDSAFFSFFFPFFVTSNVLYTIFVYL